MARIEIRRDLLSEVLNVNLTHVSVQQNEDMRRISGWVAIAAVPTMLAGLWGMNFVHMPELDEWWGYPAGAVDHGRVGVPDVPPAALTPLDLRRPIPPGLARTVAVARGRP